jgi:hypothetical protein
MPVDVSKLPLTVPPRLLSDRKSSPGTKPDEIEIVAPVMSALSLTAMPQTNLAEARRAADRLGRPLPGRASNRRQRKLFRAHPNRGTRRLRSD